jgi:hypothetical protein
MVQNGYRSWAFGPAGGQPLGLVGVDPTPGCPSVGIIWAVSTPAIHQHKKDFIILSREFVYALNDDFPILTNMIDARNVVHQQMAPLARLLLPSHD